MLTGKKANNGYTVSFSHRRVKVLQQPNLQARRASALAPRAPRHVSHHISHTHTYTQPSRRSLSFRGCVATARARSAAARRRR